MSRVGKHAVVVPGGVTVDIKGQHVSVKGKLGALNATMHEDVEIILEAGKVSVKPRSNSARARMHWGTARNLLQNMCVGVTDGFKRVLEIEGVGFRASVQGKNLVMQMGFSHEVVFPIPDGITIKAEKPTLLSITGYDRQQVGQVAAEIRSVRKPEPYKGKGIRYSDEKVRRKEGKKK